MQACTNRVQAHANDEAATSSEQEAPALADVIADVWPQIVHRESRSAGVDRLTWLLKMATITQGAADTGDDGHCCAYIQKPV